MSQVSIVDTINQIAQQSRGFNGIIIKIHVYDTTNSKHISSYDIGSITECKFIPTLINKLMELHQSYLVCKCGIQLPIPYFHVKLSWDHVELSCHLCEMTAEMEHKIFAPEHRQIQNLVENIRHPPEKCTHDREDYVFVSKAFGVAEITRTCSSCLWHYENRNIYCNTCASIIYTKFEYMAFDNKVYCSPECKLSQTTS